MEKEIDRDGRYWIYALSYLNQERTKIYIEVRLFPNTGPYITKFIYQDGAATQIIGPPEMVGLVQANYDLVLTPVRNYLPQFFDLVDYEMVSVRKQIIFGWKYTISYQR